MFFAVNVSVVLQLGYTIGFELGVWNLFGPREVSSK